MRARTPYVKDMSENITIYTTPQCPGCSLTKRKLDKAGIEYELIDLSQRPDLIEQFRAEGLLSAPIIETGHERSSGFNPDHIRKIIALASPHAPLRDEGATNASTTGTTGTTSTNSRTGTSNESSGRSR